MRRSILEELFSINVEDLAKRIDHALITPWASEKELEKAIEETKRNKLRCLILSPSLARIASSLTSKLCIGAVVGFPYGYQTIESKIKELEDVISYGVNEVDYMLNIQNFIMGRKDEVANELKASIEICKEVRVKCKIIIEAPALNNISDVIELVRIASSYEPEFIKTSSGLGPRPTSFEDIIIIDKTLRRLGKRSKVGIKAAGGIRTCIQALTMIALGADILGTSTPLKILDECKKLKEFIER